MDNSETIFSETKTYLTALQELYASSGFYEKYPLTKLWGQQNMQELLAIIEKSKSPEEAIAEVHKTFMFSVNTHDPEIKQLMIDWYLEYCHSHDIDLETYDLSIAESPFSNPENAMTIWGRLLAPDFLRNLILYWELKTHCDLPEKPKFLELGAGYGGLARVIKLFNPQAQYTIIDIPETLYFSALFLRLNFPQCTFRYISNPAHLNSNPADYPSDFTFIPAALAEHLKGQTFDVFCNTASLGEMKNTTIRYWMDLVQNKLNVKYFFGHNRFLNTIALPSGQYRAEENCCSVSFDTRWKMLYWELEAPFTRCPYLETEVSRNLTVIAERREDRDFQEDSRRLLQPVLKQDWYLHYSDNNAMKLRDNILAPDLTMKGTLFALWESIRLHPNPVNAAVMLQYLSTLTRKNPFEEIFFYKSLVQ